MIAIRFEFPIEIENEIKSLKKYLLKHMDESELPEINALMVFTHEDVEINGEGSPVPAMKLKQLKDFIRQKTKQNSCACLLVGDKNCLTSNISSILICVGGTGC